MFVITKKFTVETAHIVRNCSTERCSQSIHGHSATIEVSLKSKSLDNGYMVYDFGCFKNGIKPFIDSFDHCYVLWDKEDENFKNFIKTNSSRWIEISLSPSAESLSYLLYYGIRDIISRSKFQNNEDFELDSVTYHETATGSCKYYNNIVLHYDDIWKKFKFSDAVMKDWPCNITTDIIEHKIPTKQI